MIVCGWCHSTTEPDRCSHCGRDPALPWTQRDELPPVVLTRVGRPALDAQAIRVRLEQARDSLGADATDAELAEWLAVDERTVQRWRAVAR